jgi:phosphonate transport system substrate-binding protein
MCAVRLGLIPGGGDGSTREREFVAALATALGVDVDVHRAADYRVVMAGIEQRLVDFAWLPPLVAARAVKARQADPIAIAVRQGATSYATALVARPESPLRSIADLQGTRVAWVDRESASGYVVVRNALVRAGVRLTRAFGEETFVRSHAAVARAVLDGKVDVGATCVHANAGVVRIARSSHAGDEGLTTDELRVVFEAGPIPSDLFAVRRDVPVRVRSIVEAALLHGMNARLHAAARALMLADGFAVPTREHRRMLEALVDG